jgi:hypothetical protein
MNRNILQEEIQWLLEAIHEQSEIIRTYEGRIPQIELDILMENVRNLYEKLHLLNRSNDPYHFFQQKEQEPVHMKPARSTPPAPAETEPEHPASKEKIPVRVAEEAVFRGKQKGNTEKQEDPGDEPDLFSSGFSGFSEKLQEARQSSISPKSSRTSSSDLKSLISINEKFLFINELFEGNLREYNETIESLNRFSELKSAMEFLDLQRQKSHWNSESAAFVRLKDLLMERFT